MLDFLLEDGYEGDPEAIYSGFVVLGIFLILLMLYYFVIQRFQEHVTLHSGIDNRYYSVLRNQNNPQRAADMLARINQKILILLNHLKLYGSPEQKENIERLITRYDPENLSEASEEIQNGEVSSYTVNKGEQVGICLKCRNTEKCNPDTFEPDNTLMFVVIHELAHVGNDEDGHGDKFQLFNRYLLKEAEKVKVWRYRDYADRPVSYCGTTINANP